ncbi:hypothetical protein K438DRAFT_461010 [Mycena galopus ATCC 62051]|nr:hypothetical protein K438DRAFT_461010 [Mycena galopus ATCC 62051]
MTNVWSGGLAFSYFNATSAGHQFRMATLSADNTTVTTDQDFTNFATQYDAISFVNSPAQAAAPAVMYGAAPQKARASRRAECVAEKLGCSFVEPADGEFTVLVGTLVGEVYGLLPSVGGNCDDIASNGTTGVYRVMAICDLVTRLSYAFFQYCELIVPQPLVTFPATRPSTPPSGILPLPPPQPHRGVHA